VWVPHLSKRIHSICAKFKPYISWIFSLPTIHRVLNLSIRLVLQMPKQQLNIPWVGEHILQAVNHRYVPHHKGGNFSLFRPFNLLIVSDILPLLSLPFITLFIEIILNLLTVIVSFVSTSIGRCTTSQLLFLLCSNASAQHCASHLLHIKTFIIVTCIILTYIILTSIVMMTTHDIWNSHVLFFPLIYDAFYPRLSHCP
jgi:hypothetical protein